MMKIEDIRRDYRLLSLSEKDVARNPFVQFKKWWDEVIQANIDEPNAMTLATADRFGKPSARIVLLKGLKENGFEFFTNYESHKAKEIAENENVALVFFWKELERQVRIEGIAKKTDDLINDEYFMSRPAESRIGAWASPQSTVIASAEVLQTNAEEMKTKFAGKEISRPPFWGGYSVKPTMIEFWQGRPGRMHDRVQYLIENGTWTIKRLAP